MSRSLYRLSPPAAALSGEITIPGSKSYTNRALILAALAPGKSILESASHSDDSRVLCRALGHLGVRVDESGEDLIVSGGGGKFRPFKGEINVGPAGTSMRFLAALCAFAEGSEIILSGSDRMHQRPIRELVDALRGLGAKIEYLGTEGCPPLKITGVASKKDCRVAVDGSVSSQFFSALLLAAPLLQSDLTIEVRGEQISKSYIDMTLSSLSYFRVPASNENYRRYTIKGGALPSAVRYPVEGDASGASYFWGLAAVSRGRVRVNNINPESAQGDVKFPKLLEKMGCSVSYGGEKNEPGWIEVVGRAELTGIEADMELMPDTAQTLAVIAACARGKTHIKGLKTLRIKETDRLLALKQELAKLGVTSEIGPDFITVTPAAQHAARIATYDDHRMAMAFAMLGARIPIEIEEPEVVNKSFPAFWQHLGRLGVEVKSV